MINSAMSLTLVRVTKLELLALLLLILSLYKAPDFNSSCLLCGLKCRLRAADMKYVSKYSGAFTSIARWGAASLRPFLDGHTSRSTGTWDKTDQVVHKVSTRFFLRLVGWLYHWFVASVQPTSISSRAWISAFFQIAKSSLTLYDHSEKLAKYAKESHNG